MEELKKSRRDQNIEKVVQIALQFFITYGIDQSKVSDIAREAGLTERSVFRYFKTKEDLVLESAMLFWSKVVDYVNRQCAVTSLDELTGIEQIRFVFNKYCDLYFTSKKEFIFVSEAEAYLKRRQKLALLVNKPPKKLTMSHDPLANAIKKGVRDKTVNHDINLNILYLNSYDSLLGFLQKLSMDINLNDQVARQRLNLFADTLTNMYANNK